MADPLLIANGLTTGYGKLQVLWGAGLDVKAGETVVLLGANGAGKTTLLKVLLGLMPAWQGQVSLAGEDITRLRTDHRVRRGMAYMSELGVFPGLSIAENIRIGGQFVPKDTLRKRIDTLFAAFPDLAARQKALEDAKAKIRALLTPDQQKQLDAIPLPGQKPPDGAATAPTPGQ